MTIYKRRSAPGKPLKVFYLFENNTLYITNKAWDKHALEMINKGKIPKPYKTVFFDSETEMKMHIAKELKYIY